MIKKDSFARYAIQVAVLSLCIQACSDDGVRIGTGADGAAPVITPPDFELTEPTDTDTSGTTLPPTDSAAQLDAADIAASRFLAQATFGATPQSIAELRSQPDFSAWIDQQMTLPVSLTEPYTRANSNGSNRAARHEAWWNNALTGPDQLRQRVAFALSQLFVVSDLDYLLGNAQYGMAHYYDMLSQHAFGNYRELLEAVTLHPVMGVYLSMVRNEKADPENNIRPDENYAREVLQLFSIGLYTMNERGELLPPDNPEPTYTQATVEAFARVFTGWNFDRVPSWSSANLGAEGVFTSPMVPDERYHDSGAKILLNGAVAPAGLSVRDDLEAALDNIFTHPNVGVLVAKHLIQRLVTSNPKPDYIARMSAVFNNNGAGVRGDLGALVRAILLDPEAREGQNNPGFGKIREPIIQLAHLWRALNGTPGTDANDIHNTADFTLQRLDEMSGQAVMRSPSVFNFYLPEHTIIPGGQTLSPEMQIMTEANLAATHNNYHHQVYRFSNRSDITGNGDNTRVTTINLEPLSALASEPDRLLNWYNLVLFAGAMPDAMRTTLSDYMRTLPDTDSGRYARAQDTLFMILSAPQWHIQR